MSSNAFPDRKGDHASDVACMRYATFSTLAGSQAYGKLPLANIPQGDQDLELSTSQTPIDCLSRAVGSLPGGPQSDHDLTEIAITVPDSMPSSSSLPSLTSSATTISSARWTRSRPSGSSEEPSLTNIGNANRGLLISPAAPYRLISDRNFSVVLNAFKKDPDAEPYKIRFLALCLEVSHHGLVQWFFNVSKSVDPDSPRTKGRKSRPSKVIASWKRKIIEHGLTQWLSPEREVIEFVAGAMDISPDLCWQFVNMPRLPLKVGDCNGEKSSRRAASSPLDEGEPTLDTNFHDANTHDVNPHNVKANLARIEAQSPSNIPTNPSMQPDNIARFLSLGAWDSPPWFKIAGVKCAGVLASDDRHTSPGPESNDKKRALLKILEELSDPTEGRILNRHPGACPAMSRRSRDCVSTVDSEESDGGLEGPGIGEEFVTCSGAGPARFALDSLEKCEAENLLDLGRVQHEFRQCPSGTESTPASTSNQAAEGASSSPRTSIACTNKKRKTPPAGEEDEEEKEGDRDKRTPSKKARADIETKVRWDCCFNRRPFGATSTGHGCAKTGLLFNDLWRHLKRDHYGCHRCALRFKDEQARNDHWVYRFDNPSLCTPNFYGNPSTYLGYEDLKKMNDEYIKRDLQNLQKTWAAWWELIHAKENPGHAPCGIHQGTISFPSANITELLGSAITEYNTKAGQENLPMLDTQASRQEIVESLESKLRLFSLVTGRRQRRAPRPAQTGLGSSASGAEGRPPNVGSTTAVAEDPFPASGVVQGLDSSESLTYDYDAFVFDQSEVDALVAADVWAGAGEPQT